MKNFHPHPDASRVVSHFLPYFHPRDAEMKLVLRATRWKPTDCPDLIHRPPTRLLSSRVHSSDRARATKKK